MNLVMTNKTQIGNDFNRKRDSLAHFFLNIKYYD